MLVCVSLYILFFSGIEIYRTAWFFIFFMSLSSAPLNQTVVVFVSFFLAPAPGVQIVRGGIVLSCTCSRRSDSEGGIVLSCTCSRRSDSEGGSLFSCSCSRRSDSERGGGVEGWERERKIVLSPLRFFRLVLLRYEKLLLLCNGLKITRVNSKY